VAEPSPGQRIGNDENPNRYTLREPVKRGGEGTIWRATSLRPSGRETWTSAIKIVDAGSLQIPFDKTPSEVLTDYCDRASRARLEAAGLPCDITGTAGGEALVLMGGAGPLCDIPLDRLRDAHEGWMPTFMA